MVKNAHRLAYLNLLRDGQVLDVPRLHKTRALPKLSLAQNGLVSVDFLPHVKNCTCEVKY